MHEVIRVCQWSCLKCVFRAFLVGFGVSIISIFAFIELALKNYATQVNSVHIRSVETGSVQLTLYQSTFALASLVPESCHPVLLSLLSKGGVLRRATLRSFPHILLID